MQLLENDANDWTSTTAEVDHHWWDWKPLRY